MTAREQKESLWKDQKLPSFSERPASERPREKLEFLGEKSLSDEELISLVFGSGATLPISRVLLQQVGGLRSLRTIGLSQLRKLPRIGPARAIQLKAALELGRRSTAEEPVYGQPIRSALDIVSLLQSDLEIEEQESFHVFGLDNKHRIRTRNIAAIGQIDRVHVSISDIFRPLVREGMAATLVAHNHPSGDPTPSEQDIILTQQLAQAAKLLGIRLVDHIIIGTSGYYSFSEDRAL